MITIRKETPGDRLAVRYINKQAFGSDVEPDLIDKLRVRQAVTLSLVAVQENELLGHILFSPVTVESGSAVVNAVALGPMSVLPEYQRQNIGSQLVRAGLEELHQAGHEIVVVLGNPDYYQRFGFSPTSKYGIKCEFDVPDEVFMALELREGALAEVSGTVKYQPEFSEGE